MTVIITSIKARTVRMALDRPVSISTRRVDARYYTLVRVECADGTYGIGFCHGGTRFGGLATTAVRELLAPLFVGEDPHRTEGLWQEAYQDSLLNGRSGAVMRALSAVDNALWDRNARSVGLPLWRYLGAVQRDSVPAYASAGYYGAGGADAVRDEAARYAATGFTAYKMKIGGASPAEDTARVAAAREALGDEALLLLDANNAWKDLASALRALTPLLPYRPYFVEEPFGPDDIANHARLAQSLPLALATGEIVAGRWGHQQLMALGGVTVLQPDALVCGGITEWRRIAAAAAAQGIAVAPHSIHDLHAHLVASTPNALFAEYFASDDIVPFGRLLSHRLEARNGRLVLPTGPGLGFDFDDGAVARYALDVWS